MIKSFRHGYTKILYSGRSVKNLPGDIQSRALRKLISINEARSLEDLRKPKSNRLHKLQNEYWSISINDQWRITFFFKNGDAFDVGIIDYH